MDSYDYGYIISVFFIYNKEKISSIGINAENLKNSIILGSIGGFLLLAIQTTLFVVQGKKHLLLVFY